MISPVCVLGRARGMRRAGKLTVKRRRTGAASKAKASLLHLYNYIIESLFVCLFVRS